MILKVTRSSLFAWILSVLIITAVFFTLKANGPDHQPSMFVSEIPDYEGMSDFDKVKAIRRWVYRNVDVAADEKSLIDSPYNLSLLTLDDIILLVRKDVGGYWCGGVAYTTTVSILLLRMLPPW